MREVVATVIAVNDQLATVEIMVQEGGCGRCHETGGCGGANISRSFCATRRTLDLPNVLNVVVGDRVNVGIEERSLTAIANRLYVFPLLALLLGAACGHWVLGASGPVGSIVGSGLGGVFWLVYARRNPLSVSHPRMLGAEAAVRNKVPDGPARASA